MKMSVAIVGKYQIGKSTLLNCLLNSNRSVIGNGLCTTSKELSFDLSDYVSLIDTPGFGSPNKSDDQIMLSAIEKADAVLCLLEPKILGSETKYMLNLIRNSGHPAIFVCNCNHEVTDYFNPDDEVNCDVADTIYAQIKGMAIDDFSIPVEGCPVFRINSLLAAYGLGLLDQLAVSSDSSESEVARSNIESIEDFITAEMEDISPEKYRNEMLRRSNIKVLRDFIEEMPLKVLMSFAHDTSNEIKRFSDRFLADLQNDCNECACSLERGLAK